MWARCDRRLLRDPGDAVLRCVGGAVRRRERDRLKQGSIVHWFREVCGGPEGESCIAILRGVMSRDKDDGQIVAGAAQQDRQLQAASARQVEIGNDAGVLVADF